MTLLTRPVVLAVSYALAIGLGWALTIIGLAITGWWRGREARRLARWRDTQADVKAAQIQAQIDEATWGDPVLRIMDTRGALADLTPARLRPDQPDAAGPPVDTAVLRAAPVLTGAIVDAEPAADGTLQWELVELGAPPLTVEERVAVLLAKADAILSPAEDWNRLATQAHRGAR